MNNVVAVLLLIAALTFGFGNQSAHSEETGKNSELVLSVLSAMQEASQIASLIKESSFSDHHRLKRLMSSCDRMTSIDQISSIAGGRYFKNNRVSFSEYVNILSFILKRIGRESAEKASSCLLLLVSANLPMDEWYGFANIFVYLIDERYKSESHYRLLIETLAREGCSPNDKGAVSSVDVTCITSIARDGFFRSGEFKTALWYANECVRLANQTGIQSKEIRAKILIALAELEFDHGTRGAAAKALSEIPAFSDEDFAHHPDWSKELTASEVKSRIAALRNRLASKGGLEKQSDISEIAGELARTEGSGVAAGVIPKFGQALSAMRNDELGPEVVAAFRKRLSKLIEGQRIPARIGGRKLSMATREDMAVLGNFHFNMNSNDRSEFYTFLTGRNQKQKQRAAAAIYDRTFVDFYSQWGIQVEFFPDLSGVIDTLDNLNYPLAAQIARENFVRISTGYSSDGAWLQGIQTANPEIFAKVYLNLADYNVRAKRFTKANESLNQFVDLVGRVYQNEWKGGRQDIGRVVARFRPYLSSAIDLLNITSSRAPDIELALRASQLVQVGEVGLAMQAGVIRSAVRDEETASVLANYQKTHDQLGLLVSIDDRLNFVVRDGIEKAIADQREAESRLDDRLGQLIPFLENYASVAPVSTEQLRSAIRPDEALIMVTPGAETTALFGISKQQAVFATTKMTNDELARSVEELRKGLDPNTVHLDQPESFDSALAHKLYGALLKPLQDVIDEKQNLVLIIRGPGSSLPFHLLIRSTSRANEYLSNVDWVARHHSIVLSPSASSFVAGRNDPQIGNRVARLPLLGVGDPQFSDSGKTRTIASLDRAFRGSQVDLEALSGLAPLPETRQELDSVARSLGADKEALLFAEDATETHLKSMSDSGELAKYQILYFATHGLVAGELNGENEPGLVLTLPSKASELDDGLLVSSEIARLKLDAEWVVLSACNTAAPQGTGAEAFSGLAKSFFSAGTRSVLASHWPVISTAAVALTTRTFELISAKHISRAKALQEAMLEQIEQGAERSHPAYWAPFVLMGQ